MKKYVFMVLLIVVTFLFTLFVFSPTFYQKDVVNVPDVINHDVNQAIEELKSNRLAVEISYLDSNEKADIVLETVPSSGYLVKEGSVVRMNISNGLLNQRMVNVENQYYDDALVKIKEVNPDLMISVVEIEDNTLPSEYVKKQFPKENEVLNTNTEIILFVTKKTQYYVIPNMLYWPKEEVERYCEQIKLNVLFSYEYNAKIEKERVIKQSILENTKILINKQNSIVITLSLGPDPSYIPDIIDMGEIEGVILLKKLGIAYEVSYVMSNEEKGVIIDVFKEVSNDTLAKVKLLVSGGKYEQGVSD